jgi:N-acetylmuramoyl-L-alanine amidase
MRLVFIAAIAALLAIFPAAAQEATVSAAHIEAAEGQTRVTLDLSARVEPSNLFTLAAEAGRPYRVVLDLPEVNWAVAGGTTLAGRGLVQQVRYGRNRPGQSRVVLDLLAPANIADMQVTDAIDGVPARIVLTLAGANEQTFEAASGFPDQQARPAEREPEHSGGTFQNIEAVLASLGEEPEPRPDPSGDAASEPLTRPVIVIDPGHGGRDPGMSLVNGREEKDVVLDIARSLRDELTASGLFEVHMTRDSDIFLPLNDRYAIAQNMGADLFISVHVDSNDDHAARGATVYTLSERASDAEAARVARRENQSDAVAGYEVDEELTRILIDLAQRETMNLSSELAGMVVASFGSHDVSTVGRPHRFAGFRVLTAPDVPSILIETGFGTNRQDASLLVSDRYQAALGRSLTDALIAYFDLDAADRAALAQNSAPGN